MGTCIAGRFTLMDQVGRGGMGMVYRATDALTGRNVALKLLHAVTSQEAAHRFNREAELLAELHHPAIVAYVAHGVMESGQPFLAMESLEGEDLAQRLARQPLTLSETLALVRRTAEGLALAHERGIVHRDLKPSNLFLRSGRPEDVALVDFGLARYALTQEAVTGSQVVLGTPGYMAPEQASCRSDLTPSADIFSLGCVLYECLTGQPPFSASHFAAALAKILYADPLPLLALRDDLPPGMQLLLDAMLVKDPRRRMPTATHLLEALARLEARSEPPHGAREVHTSGLAGAEQQLFSVLLMSLPSGMTGPQEEGAERRLTLRDAVRPLFAPYGAEVELLADGSLVVTLAPKRGTAMDQAALAVRCALTLKQQWPEASVVLVTGRGVFQERLPVGEVMDRAGQLLRQVEQPRASSALVVMDEVTAGLLGPGFQLSRSDSGTFLLRGEQASADETRPLLGRPTPCVGREQELALLELVFTSCVEDPAARALLVTAPAGGGKSRLRHEFLRRLQQKAQPVSVLLGRADPLSEGVAYGLLGQLLRKRCGLAEAEDLAARHARLHERVTLHLPPEKAQETVEFLSELCGLPLPEEEASPRLRAARRDPRLMSAQVGRALVTFLEAECAHQPVLLVLEDLHWSDAPSVKLLNEVLRELAEQPLMVLALARPEVKESFPGLWGNRLQEMPLSGLSRKASTRLVREVLGPRVPDSVIQRAVEQSDGNVLFLEELIRMVAEGRGDAPPETVLAVLQARLLRMEPPVRHVLLAASIFGRTFWTGGVKALLGWREEALELEEHLRRLVELEVIEPQPDSRFPSVNAYRFRHALVQEAASGLVPDTHRPMGHQLAGAWLEQMGEPDALVLATHYQRGGQPERAARFYTQAAELSFEQHDLRGTLRHADAAVACGVRDATLFRLRGLQAVAACWMDEMAKVVEFGEPVLTTLVEGSPLWCRLMGGMVIARASLRQGSVDSLCERVLRTTPEPDAVTAYLESISFQLSLLCWTGERRKQELLLERMKQAGKDAMGQDAMARGWIRISEALFLHLHESQPWRAFTLVELGLQDFLQIGSARNALLFQPLLGLLQAELGALPEATVKLREYLVAARRTEHHLLTTHAVQQLMVVLAGSDEPAEQQEAHALALEFMRHDESQDPYSFRRGLANAVLARLALARGDLRGAESHARTACTTLRPFRSCMSHARTVLSTVLLAQGRAPEARQVAELAEQELAEMGSTGVYAVAVHLALAEACFTLGEVDAGERALRKASRCVHTRASDIPEGTARERFLSQVPENARTLELARQRWGESPA
jgi:hypothetical protein